MASVFEQSAQYFPTALQLFQYLDKYSRYDYDLGRRETWVETVDRAVAYLQELSENKLPASDYERIREYILTMKAAPSMRLLAMAGKAARRNNIAIYNCSYLPLDSIDSFVEELIIAMSGCGVGFSVERKYVDKLPAIKEQTGETTAFGIDDSTEGWAEAFRYGLTEWFNGRDVVFDYSAIRPAGTPLKIKGGRASGPAPLEKMMDFTRTRILSRQGLKLRPLDAHDIACMVGEAIVSGGVRRTALISLFDAGDSEMMHCKDGDLTGNEQRWMANNSAVWEKEVTQDQLVLQMCDMIKGQRGEPGIFSRHNANTVKPERRKTADFGTNPCGEINLRPYQFCNLSIAVAREDDTLQSLKDKVEIAAIIGTIQSMGTTFPGLREIWKKNCEEERLLGVDINGQMDCPLLRPTNEKATEHFQALRQHAVDINQKYAKLLGINQAAAVTCVKPSGNSGVLFNCSSGLHPRWSEYYIRNVRVQAQAPLYQLLKDQGVPMDPENGQDQETANTFVIHFPVKSPKGAITRTQLSALEQCEHWLTNKLHFTEHNPSVTINYRPEETLDLINWIWKHRNVIGGMSFLPINDANYDQMPNEEITKEQYSLLSSQFPEIDFSLLPNYEKEDQTTASTELACVSGACSIEEYQALMKQREAATL